MKWLDLLVAMQIWPSDQNTHRIYTCIFDLIIKGYLFFAGMFCMRYRNYVLILIVNLNNSQQAVFFLLELVDILKEPYWWILETLRSIWINDKCSQPRALTVLKYNITDLKINFKVSFLLYVKYNHFETLTRWYFTSVILEL